MGKLDDIFYSLTKNLGNKLDPIRARRGDEGEIVDKRSPVGEFAARQIYRQPFTGITSPLADGNNFPQTPTSQYNEPTPTPTPTPKLSGKKPLTPTPTIIQGFEDRNPEIQEIITKAFPDNANDAINVAIAESGLQPDTISPNNDAVGSSDYGIFQINDHWQRFNLEAKGYTIEDMLDPEKAADFASWLYKQQGWNPWYGARKIGLAQ